MTNKRMTFEEFKQHYAKDKINATLYARMLGVTLAQVQLWVIKLTTK